MILPADVVDLVKEWLKVALQPDIAMVVPDVESLDICSEPASNNNKYLKQVVNCLTDQGEPDFYILKTFICKLFEAVL